MARTFRVYGKKLGNRRTGSEFWGQLVLGLFLGACYLAGCALLAHSVHERLLPEWRVVNYYRPIEAAVLHARVGEQVERGTRFYRPEIQLQYQVEGKSLTSWSQYDASGTRFARPEEPQELVSRFRPGQTVPAWYDPLQPARIVLFRGFRWLTAFWLLLPSAFLAVGGSGLARLYLRSGRSREEQALVAQARRRLAPQEVLGIERESKSPWPQVPSWRHLCNSPGTKQTWRLPALAAHSWRMAALVAVCAAVNLVAAVFAFVAIRGYVVEALDWRLTGFALVATVLGLGLIGYCLRMLYLATAWGPTILEISELPLRPGGSYSIYVAQSSRGRIRQFQVFLVCEEQAHYREGTDSRLACQTVLQQEVVALNGGEGPRGPLASAAELKLPARAMHSFAAEHNSVQWRLVVRGQVEGWPALDRTFPVIVAPEAEGEVPA